MNPDKIIFISFNQALHGLVIRLLERHNLRGYTQWDEIRGVGSRGGEPHQGSHAWPTLNGALLVACPGAVVPTILEELHALDESQPLQGLLRRELLTPLVYTLHVPSFGEACRFLLPLSSPS